MYIMIIVCRFKKILVIKETNCKVSDYNKSSMSHSSKLMIKHILMIPINAVRNTTMLSCLFLIDGCEN